MGLGWSDEELMKLVLASDDEENYQTLAQYREEVGKLPCVRRMLDLFERSESGELCKKTWETVFNICLTDDEPEMDQESSLRWTEAFLRGLKNQNPEIRKAAADALSLRSNQQDLNARVIQVLMDGLADENEDVRFACGWALQRAGSLAVPYLIRALADTRYQRPNKNREDRCSSVWDILFTIDRILSRAEIDPKHRDDCAKAAANFLEERSPDDGLDYLDVWKAADTLGEHIGGRTA